MEAALQLAFSTLTSPMLIFFAVGAGLALLSRELTMPPMISRALGLLLIFAIGVKGGASLGEHGFGGDVLVALFAGLGLSVAMTVLGFMALRATTELPRADAAAVAAHYGSISIVTFATMSLLLKINGIAYDGWMVAIAALMEAPAILTALVIARLAAPSAQAALSTPDGGTTTSLGVGDSRTEGQGGLLSALGTVAQDRGVQLLLGAFALGWLAGELGIGYEQDIAFGLFPALLCIFLLDQGLVVGRRLYRLAKRFEPRLALFAVAMPLAGGMIAVLLGAILGLSAGNTALLATLAASASYIAAPAAIRMALPEARPELYLTFPLCLTLPFNLIVGLPLYLAAATLIAG
ncbi:MAG: sodium-dependent bicarbonate transport family permease [Pseudomonadota bacterium]